jgi:transcriptional regulator with XRE-family HTH domain
VPPEKVSDKRLGNAIAALRKAKGLTQEQVAQESGLTLGTYSRTERGLTNPTWSTVNAIADGLGVGISELAAAFEQQPPDK